MDNQPMLYRLIAQSGDITVTAENAKDMVEEEAKKKLSEAVIAPTGNYSPFVILPICTEFQWKYGQINFCPRCGKNICGSVGGDYLEGVTNELEFECPECNAHMSVYIMRTTEEEEEDQIND